MARVSVIVPVGNDRWLQQCLASICAQAVSALDLVVVEDRERRGAAWARNRGLEQATGDFVFFCDADDVMGDLRALIDAAAETQADLVVGSFVKRGLLNCTVRDFKSEKIMDMLEVARYIRENMSNPRHHQMLSGCWGKLFKMSIIRKHGLRFDESLRTAEDLDFNFEYLQRCDTVCFIPEITYYYIKHGGSLTMKPDERMLDVLKVLKKLERYGDIGHSFIYHAVLYAKRFPGLVRILMLDPDFRKYIATYVPAKGNYWLLPWLMKLGLAKPAEWAARL